MTWADEVTKPLDRVLKWIEEGAKSIVGARQGRRRVQHLRTRFDTAYETGAHKWLTLELLTSELGFNPASTNDLDRTASLLVRVPARPDRSPANRERARLKQLWGAERYVGP
jgi:hypothetical protein